MRNISTVLLVCSLFFAPAVMAHGGPGHSPGNISDGAVIIRATDKIKSLVRSGKLDESWTAVDVKGATKEVFDDGVQWVVTFKNEKVMDSAKKTLYIFFTLDGTYIATNFTGK